ncbi:MULTISPECIES: hypothetical protein [Enterobacter cloacae complex]|uniref:hypothetical protein n=1 Tax=Enterobacter cloacae complex TaxID=354276 RepID=UPI0010116FCA|nr:MULTISPECIES: hypothetical protein [Enterobacter cloacae complex]MBG0579359.1 hypothetical protein [Enterobacter kobei]MDQ6584449.1 hypothetical protein [Enterobacter hormaechei]RYA41438.1 hypothetical protein DD603_13015 [Enterobacter cloacae complex sp. 2DZ2F2B]RYA45720.1 hypothetical protein DD605_06335 [Enterobacter cloacae complex sp. 3DZ3S2B]
MAKTNKNVDFIDNDEQGNIVTNKDQHHKNKRAELAHKLAVVLLFDQKAKHLENEKKKAKPIKRISAKKGALEGV